MGSREHDGGTAVVTKKSQKVKRPSLYRVLLHNDDYTTMEFVVYILRLVFHLPEEEAVRIMLKVHNEGVGLAGTFTYEIAEAKVKKVERLASEREYPLRCTVEKA